MIHEFYGTTAGIGVAEARVTSGQALGGGPVDYPLEPPR